MDVVEFRMATEALGVGDVVTVTPYVNGMSLIELARRAELPSATADGDLHLAGSYAGLVVDPSAAWQGWYLDDRPQSWFGDGDSCLLGCTCGDTGCWPLTAIVTVTRDLVTWSQFRTGHRAWDLGRLGCSPSIAISTKRR